MHQCYDDNLHQKPMLGEHKNEKVREMEECKKEFLHVSALEGVNDAIQQD